MKIGELASRSRVSERMLRYYEKEGLLRPGRTASGYRDYSDEDVAVVRRIVLFNSAGLTLRTIAALLPCILAGAAAQEPCEALKDRIGEKLEELDQQIAQLQESRNLLASIGIPRRPDASAGR